MTASQKSKTPSRRAAVNNLVSFSTGRGTTNDTVDIRREILARDGDCCHFCKAKGGASILRVRRGPFDHYVDLTTLMAHDANDGEPLGVVPADTLPLGRSSRVVLDLAYLDGNPGNQGRRGRRDNVVLACQRCNTAIGMAAIQAAAEARLKAAHEAEFGPELPLF
jgi:5-methylcytosine-specific restriction endonuclease McrA